MISIAIIEDDERDAENLSAVLARYQDETGELLQIHRFRDAEAFLTRYRPVYDLIFMDIRLGEGGINGIAAAKRMRKFDANVALIFTTSMARYAVKGYEVDALDYLIKPVEYYKVKMRMDRLCRTKADQFASVAVLLDGNRKRIPASEIYYVEVLDHTLVFHTKEEEYSGRGTLREAEKTLIPAGFARCSVSCLVNLNHFRGLKGNVLLIGPYQLRITRGKKKQFLRELSVFLSGGEK